MNTYKHLIDFKTRMQNSNNSLSVKTWILFLIFILIIGIVSHIIHNHDILMKKTKEKIEYIQNEPESKDFVFNNEFIQIKNKEKYLALATDLIHKQKHINEQESVQILKYISIYSEMYEISPILLYSVLWNESRLRNNVMHKKVYVRSLSQEIQAIGMGGIVWEFWCSDLIMNTSIKSKDDLSITEKNIEACAFILSHLIQKPKLRVASNEIESGLGRFYGKYNRKYIKKVLSKVDELNEIKALYIASN